MSCCVGVNALCPDKSIVAENRKDEQEAEVKNSFKPWKSSRPWKWIGLAALGGVCGSGVAVYYGASVLMYGGVGGAAGAFVRGCFEETAIVYKRGPEMERLNRVIAEAFKNYKGKKYMGFLKSLFDIRRGIDITWNDEDKPVAITVNCDDLVTKLLANNFNPDGIASILYLLADALMNVIESFSHMSQEKVKAQIIKILKEITKLKNNKLIDKAKALDEKIRGGLGLDESLGGALSKSVSARVYELQQLALIDLIGMRLKEENIKEAEDCLKSFRQVRQELRVIESDSIKDDLMDYLSETVFGVTVAGDKAGDKSYEAGNSSQHDSDFQIIKSFNVVREKLRVHDYLAATQELNNNKTKGSSLSEFWYLMAESYRHMGSFTLSRMYNAQAISLINVSVKESLKKDLDIQRRYLEVYWLNAEDRLKKYGDIGFSAPSASEIERFYPVFVMDGYDNTAIGQGYRAVSSYEYSLLRNIMFALWISYIEIKSQRHFSEVFRVVSGSSMSAIIAAMITVSDKDSEGKLVPKFSGYEILEVCREMYKYYVDNYRRPLSIEYLESKLSEYLGDARLNETLSHVVIPAQKGKELFMFDSKDSNKGNEIILSAIKLKHAVIASIASSPVLDSYSFAESYPLKKDKNKKVAPINEKFEGDGALTSFPVQDVFRLGKFQRDKEMLLLSFGTREDKSEISGLNPKLKYRWEMPLTGIIVGHDKYEYSINKFEMLKMAPIWAGFNFIDDQVINVTDIRYNLLLGHLGIDYDPFFGRKYVEEAVTTRIIRAESDEVLTGELHGYNQKIYFVKGCGEASICDFLQVPLDELSKRMLSYISEEGNITQKKKLLVRSKEDLFAKHFVLNSSREKKVFDDLYKKVGRLSKDFKSHMSSVETQSAFSAEDVQSINSFDNTKERVNMAWTMLVKKNLTTLAEGFSTLVERSKKIYDQIDNFLNNSEVQLEYLVYLLKRGVFREGAVDLFMMAARSVNKILHIWSLEDDNDSSKIVVSETYGRGNSSSVHVLRSESIITPLIECEVSSNTNLLAAEQQPSQENGNSSGACT